MYVSPHSFGLEHVDPEVDTGKSITSAMDLYDFRPDHLQAVRDRLKTVAESLHQSDLASATMLRESRADLTAFLDFPQAHQSKIRSVNAPERLNKELKLFTDVLGTFSNTAVLLLLSSAVLIKAHDDVPDTDRRYLSGVSL